MKILDERNREVLEYLDTPKNWQHLRARKGSFQEMLPDYFQAKDGSIVRRLSRGVLEARLVSLSCQSE